MRISRALFWFFIATTIIAVAVIFRLLLPLIAALRKYDFDVNALVKARTSQVHAEEHNAENINEKGKARETAETPTTRPVSHSHTTASSISSMGVYIGLLLFLVGGITGRIFSIPTILCLLLAVASGFWAFDFRSAVSISSVNIYGSLLLFLVGGIAGRIVGIPGLLCLLLAVASGFWAFDFRGVSLPTVRMPSLPAGGGLFTGSILSDEEIERKKTKKKQFNDAWADFKLEALQTARIKLAVVRKNCREELSAAGLDPAALEVYGTGVPEKRLEI